MDYVVSKVLIDLYKNIENNEIFKDENIGLDKLLDIVKKYMEKQNPVYSVIEQTTLLPQQYFAEILFIFP